MGRLGLGQLKGGTEKGDKDIIFLHPSFAHIVRSIVTTGGPASSGSTSAVYDAHASVRKKASAASASRYRWYAAIKSGSCSSKWYNVKHVVRIARGRRADPSPQ